MKVMNGLDLQSRPITNLSDPGNPQDAATKNYVDAAFRNVDWKQEVIAASTGNVNIAGPGTAIDGITLTNLDRVLLKDQTTASQNGIWIFNGSAAAMTRAADADTGARLSGATVTVQRGTVNADRVYRVLTDDAITVNTTAISFGQVGGGGGATYTAGPAGGLQLASTEFNIKLKATGSGLTVDANGLGVDPSVVTRKYAAAIGNGSLTTVPVVHNLGTRDVDVTVYDATNYEEVWVDNLRVDANTVNLIFATAPTTGQYRVVING